MISANRADNYQQGEVFRALVHDVHARMHAICCRENTDREGASRRCGSRPVPSYCPSSSSGGRICRAGRLRGHLIHTPIRRGALAAPCLFGAMKDTQKETGNEMDDDTMRRRSRRSSRNEESAGLRGRDEGERARTEMTTMIMTTIECRRTTVIRFKRAGRGKRARGGVREERSKEGPAGTVKQRRGILARRLTQFKKKKHHQKRTHVRPFRFTFFLRGPVSH